MNEPLLAFAFLLLNLSGWVVAAIVTVLAVRALDARRMLDLKPWHRLHTDGDFNAARHPGLDFNGYRALEVATHAACNARLAAALEADDCNGLNRYWPQSRVHPGEDWAMWNGTVELVPTRPRGAALLVHGLTDSPYSMRTLAQLLHARGYRVVVLRLPCSGTTPGAQLSIRFADWRAAVALAARHLREHVGPDLPFLLSGFSNGGLLSVNYTLDALDDDTLPLPDRLLLFAPAIGITRIARFAGWDRSFSRVPFFAKSAWAAIQPEYDPFKYASFPKNAGHQTWLLSRRVQARLQRAAASGQIARFPSVLTFHSLVDATVQTAALSEDFYRLLAEDRHELVLFDINRNDLFQQFLREPHANLFANLCGAEDIPYRFTVISNIRPDSMAVGARSRSGADPLDAVKPLGLEWPTGVYSLSHVALTFPPDDPWYGVASADRPITLGSMQPRGERDALTVPIKQFMRLRHNPFFDYVASRILALPEVRDD